MNTEESITCAPTWTPGIDMNGPTLKTSLTELDGLEGSLENGLYGAEFMPTDIQTPYYEKMLTATVDVPWLAQSEEVSYMNRQKEMNEPHVQTYKDLKLFPISQQMHESVEGFGNVNWIFYLKVVLVVVLIYLIYQKMA